MFLRNSNSPWLRLLLGVLMQTFMKTEAHASEVVCTDTTMSGLQKTLTPYMNSIPPSKDYLCVGTGSTAQMLHPDRAPHTDLAMQGNVVLFSGSAPQQGLNFTLPVGSMVYRNQMSTLGSAEPPPQVGTAGMLLQKPWSKDFLPWTEARWHPGEDITWRGLRVDGSLHGLPYWEYPTPTGPCSPANPNDPNCLPHSPIRPLCSESLSISIGEIASPQLVNEGDSSVWGPKSSYDLILARGLFQVSKHRTNFWGQECESCAETFRDPWFQGRGSNPAFDIQLDAPVPFGSSAPVGPLRISQDFFPTFHNIYAFRTLNLDGGRLKVDFEQSAVTPREMPSFNDLMPPAKRRPTLYKGGLNGVMMAKQVMDEYGNLVAFDRVPKYDFQTDFKVPFISEATALSDSIFDLVPSRFYEPLPNAWRLPHKRLRTVQLREQGATEPAWTIAFVFEHPESDRITVPEIPDTTLSNALSGWDKSEDWRSIYSHFSQSDWLFGSLPDLNDETTLLTVQAYEHNNMFNALINGAPFQDDCFVWKKDKSRANQCYTEDPSFVVDRDDQGEAWYSGACPGACDRDDDRDGRKEEDSNDYAPYLDITNPTNCATCQKRIAAGNDANETEYGYCLKGVSADAYRGPFRQTHEDTGCVNPLYWRGTYNGASWVQDTPPTPMDPFSSWDDDEDGLIDEDGDDNPLLVHMRNLDGSCALGKDPFVPSAAILPTRNGQTWNEECRPPYQAGNDPWTYQVQYVYARSNPYWLLRKRNTPGPDEASTPLGTPAYYYHPPFTEPFWDENGNGRRDSDEPYVDVNEDHEFNNTEDFPGNIHADCVPHPSFHGPQGFKDDSAQTPAAPSTPSGINLIKRIVRMRADVTGNPNNFTEQTWLYRYNDIGFLKAVFDPADVQAIIDLDPSDTIKEPDDILKLSDAHNLAGKPLIMYASQWYTYYNPYAAPGSVAQTEQQKGLPQCYEVAPKILECDSSDPADPDDPSFSLPANACDGEALWEEHFRAEVHVDPDCSPFFKQDCGWCYARNYCSNANCADEEFCQCDSSINYSDDQLRQMGIPDAQPRFRKWMIKSARMRGEDGNMHLYRLDYLGAAGSAYEYNESTTDPHISSYADAHNITIVDEIVEQASDELNGETADRNDFYIYEDDFAVDLDSADSFNFADRPGHYGNTNQYRSTSHRLEFPAKVKTRRIVVMNYYGIAMSDRLILTPGFNGTQASLVANQQFELINKRGQALHKFDPSWVAAWRARQRRFLRRSEHRPHRPRAHRALRRPRRLVFRSLRHRQRLRRREPLRPAMQDTGSAQRSARATRHAGAVDGDQGD